jgi:hypothetical protein
VRGVDSLSRALPGCCRYGGAVRRYWFGHPPTFLRHIAVLIPWGLPASPLPRLRVACGSCLRLHLRDGPGASGFSRWISHARFARDMTW